VNDHWKIYTAHDGDLGHTWLGCDKLYQHTSVHCSTHAQTSVPVQNTRKQDGDWHTLVVETNIVENEILEYVYDDGTHDAYMMYFISTLVQVSHISINCDIYTRHTFIIWEKTSTNSYIRNVYLLPPCHVLSCAGTSIMYRTVPDRSRGTLDWCTGCAILYRTAPLAQSSRAQKLNRNWHACWNITRVDVLIGWCCYVRHLIYTITVTSTAYAVLQDRQWQIEDEFIFMTWCHGNEASGDLSLCRFWLESSSPGQVTRQYIHDPCVQTAMVNIIHIRSRPYIDKDYVDQRDQITLLDTITTFRRYYMFKSLNHSFKQETG
jgi:hypothetical protein